MAKVLLLLTTALLSAEGFVDLQKAVSEKPNDAAADLVTLSNELAEKEQAIVEQGAVISEKDEAIDALKKINAELAEQIQSLSPVEDTPVVTPKLSDETFTVNKVKYGFCFPALNLAGVLITNEDVLADKELQKKLVEMESGFIKAV
jgi:hypothetical protein